MQFHMNDAIIFHYELATFSIDQEEAYLNWLKNLCDHHKLQPDCINYIFADDEYILNINKEYLEHDYYTDIITFPISKDPLCVDIFISIDRVKENAKEYKVSIETELRRVMAHGLLHIAGFKDKEETEIKEMRHQENMALDMFLNGCQI